jgi:hypothetical protein
LKRCGPRPPTAALQYCPPRPADRQRQAWAVKAGHAALSHQAR